MFSSLAERRRIAGGGTAVFVAVVVVFVVANVATFLFASRPLTNVPSTAVAHALGSFLVTFILALLMFIVAWTSGRRPYLLLGFAFGYVAGCMLLDPLVAYGSIHRGESLFGNPQSWPVLVYLWSFVTVGCVAVAAVWVNTDTRDVAMKPRIAATVVATVVAVGLTALWVIPYAGSLPVVAQRTGEVTSLGNALDVAMSAAALVGVAVCIWAATRPATRHHRSVGYWLIGASVVIAAEVLVLSRVPNRLVASNTYTIGWYLNQMLSMIGAFVLLIALIWQLARLGRDYQVAATTDATTGLRTSKSLAPILKSELERATTLNQPVSMVGVCIDDFPALVAAAGPDVARCVLVATAARLRDRIGRAGYVVRRRGEEFGVLLANTSKEQGLRIAKELSAMLGEPFDVGGHALNVTASAAVAAFPCDARTPRELRRCTWLALDHARTGGFGHVLCYTEVLDEDAHKRSTLRGGLNKALIERSFDLDFQPIVDPSSGRLAGAEALVRWLCDGRRRPAGEFIDFAERSGQMRDIGRCVLDVLERDVQAVFDSAGDDTFFLAFNLSAVEISDPEVVRRLLGDPLRSHAAQLVVEVTESTQLVDSPQVVAGLEGLRDAGYRLAIDDFGRGYSHLARLAETQAAFIKLDKSLLERACAGDLIVEHLFAAVANLSPVLGADVIAEGVETETQREFVCAQDVGLAQGFLWSPPVPLGEFVRFARSDLARRAPTPEHHPT